MPKPSYRTYYKSAIRPEGNGFKLVLGGTGLGKTSGIVETLQKDKSGRKFIYIANRVQLLNEMADRLTAAGIGFVHQKNDPDMVLDLLADPELKQDLYALAEDPMVLKCLERINRNAHYPLEVEALLRTLDLIEEHTGSRQRELAYQVIRFFREMIRKTHQFKVYMEKQGSTSGDYARLTENPVLRTLFPYLSFQHDDGVRMLLTTVQKAYYGIFSGEQTLNLSQLSGEHGGRVIFLDEFDFLENDLIDLICRGTEISEPFKFVEYFYHAMKHNKLPAEDYHISEKLRRQIEKIIARVDRLHAYDFPHKNHFTCTQLDQLRSDLRQSLPSWLQSNQGKSLSDADLTICVFQTNRNLVNAPVYFRPTERSLEIVPEPTQLNAFFFFDQIHRATVEILRLFQQLAEENPSVHRELLSQCYETTVFKDEIWKSAPAAFLRRVHSTHFGRLLDGGFGCYELQDLQQETDREEVKFRHYSIPNSPEKILLALVKNNMVFGLSATADIHRVLRNFHGEWIRRQLEENKDATWFDPTPADRRLIRQLNEVKAKLRGNQVRVERAEPLNPNLSEHYLLLQLIEYLAVNRPGFGGDNPYARQRVSLFFATLYHITEDIAHKATRATKEADSEETSGIGASLPGISSTHLLFFSSYRQIEYLFSRYRELSGQPFQIRPIEVRDEDSRKVFRYFEITLRGQELIVMFYNAAKAREIDREEPVKQMYHQMFWQGKPVVLVTTYPSAGNGINLQYRASADSEEETDFHSVHLLDAPFFYFGRVEEQHDEDEARQIVKKNLWSLAKLYTAKQLTEGRFKEFLATIRHAHPNQWYLRQEDGVLNQLATFIQALGRVERVWSPLPDQHIRLSEDVWQAFARVMTEPQFQALTDQRADFLSNNMAEIFRQVGEAERSKRQVLEQKPGLLLAEQEKRSRAAIDSLLRQFQTYREGVAIGVGDTWLRLRELALKHEMQAPLLRKHHAVFQSSWHKQGKFYLTEGPKVLPPEGPTAQSRTWEPDSLYRQLADHPVIRRHFIRHNFELGFHFSADRFFTPYFWGTFLKGAIGEEAVKALLLAEGIALEERLPQAVFELADLKMAGFPIYFDVKNYSQATQNAFSRAQEAPPDLNSKAFLQKARKHLKTLEAFHQTPVKLIMLNLYGPLNSKLRYLDGRLHETSFEKARLILLPAILGSRNCTRYALGFERLLKDLKVWSNEKFPA